MPVSLYQAGFSEQHFKSSLGRFPTGVTVVTARDPNTDQALGLTISSFNSVSLNPPMVLWTLTNNAMSLQAFLQLKSYVIHVLAADQIDLARRFAKGSQAERFSGIELATAPNGTIRLGGDNFAAWFECYNTAQHLAGDHTIFVGQVENCGFMHKPPLIYHAGGFALTKS